MWESLNCLVVALKALTWSLLCCCSCRSEQKETIGEGNNKSEKTTVTFTLSGSSAEDVDSFIAAAYDRYREGLLQNVTANKGVEKR